MTDKECYDIMLRHVPPGNIQRLRVLCRNPYFEIDMAFPFDSYPEKVRVLFRQGLRFMLEMEKSAN